MNVKKAVRNHNKAFKVMKRTHNFMHMIQYKYAQAIVRKTVRQAKGSVQGSLLFVTYTIIQGIISSEM